MSLTSYLAFKMEYGKNQGTSCTTNERSEVEWFTLEIWKLRWEAEEGTGPASSKEDYDIKTLLERRKKQS